MCKLKHLAVAAAIVGLATHVQAGYFAGSTDFEGTDPLSDDLWSNVGESEIVADATVASVPRAANLPQSFDETIRTNVLGVDGDTPIVRDLQADGTAPTAATIYADALVKGYPLAADASAPEAGTSDKILVYTRISQDGTDTNLCVLAAASDADSTATEFVLTKSIGKDEWHRIVIKATTAGYQVYCDGVEAANLCKTSGDVDTFYALNTGDPMTSVAFQGTGYVDDLVLSNLDPAQIVHTLAWGEEFDSVSYTVDGVAGESLEGVASPYAFQAPAGSKVILTGSTGYRTFAATNTIGSASMSLALPSVTGIAKYFPQSATAGQDGTAEHPYEIPNLAALKALQAAVAATTNCAGLCFIQTADIALDAPWPGIGLQNGKDSYSTAAFNAAAFCGTYDGGNFTVSNFQMVGVAGNPANNGKGLDYCGFFNSTYGATICNLKIAYAGSLFAEDTTADTLESGATFVGVAKDSRLRNLTTLAGTVSCSKGFGGISGYTTSGTVIDSCTNNLNMTSLAKNKCGGIAMITQGGSAVTITNCQNNGTQTTESSNSEYGGIVGYVGLNTTIVDCETTVGRFLKHQGSTVTLQGVNKGDATVASYHGSATPGLNFATVEGNVATFVADAALAAGNTYKVMATNVTATFAFTAPGTISFDEALFTPTYAITAAQGLTLTDATSGNEKTYTASIAAATWIGGAQGNWEIASNWSGGFVPTADTIVTFTNDCAVGIYRDSGHCKEIVLDGAAMTFVAAAQGDYSGSVHMHFHGNNGSAVSGSGTLGVNNVSLFNANYSGALTIATGINVLGPVTFKGNHANGTTTAGSFTVTGNTAAANGVEIKTIDYSTTTFSGNISVPAGATVTFHSFSNGHTVIAAGSTATLATASGTATTLVLNGDVTMNGAVVPDDPVGYTVERTTSGNTVTYTTAVAAPAYPTYLENADATIKGKYDTWAEANGADSGSAFEKQFLLGQSPRVEIPNNALLITSIAQNATAGWDIEIGCSVENVGLSGTVGTALVNNGYLAISYAADLTGTWTTENINITASANGKVTVNVNKAGAKFMKANLSCTAEPAAQSGE